MPKASNRNLKIAAAALFVIFFVAWMFFRRSSGGDGSGSESGARSRSDHAAAAASDDDNPTNSSRRSRSKDAGINIVPADAPEVVAAIEKIKLLEAKRIGFDREVVAETETKHEFYLTAPSPEESEDINRIISEVHGFTRDNNGVKSWQETLREEYVMPSLFEGCVIQATFPNDSSSVRYRMYGIRKGMFLRWEDGRITNSDRSLNAGYLSPSLPSDSSWRFSYLYEDKDKEGK